MRINKIKREVYESFAFDFPQYVDITPNFQSLVTYLDEEELESWKADINEWLIINHKISLDLLTKLNENSVFIEFVNKDKSFQVDTIYFDSYDDALEWGKVNLGNFNIDMIQY
jgi:hypothetical protein